MTKQEILAEVDRVWNNPTYDDLLELVGIMSRYIEEIDDPLKRFDKEVEKDLGVAKITEENKV